MVYGPKPKITNPKGTKEEFLMFPAGSLVHVPRGGTTGAEIGSDLWG